MGSHHCEVAPYMYIDILGGAPKRRVDCRGNEIPLEEVRSVASTSCFKKKYSRLMHGMELYSSNALTETTPQEIGGNI